MKSHTYLFIVFLLFLSTVMLMAQPGGGPSTPTPIDGGIGLLIAAAIAYGGKKAFDKKKES